MVKVRSLLAALENVDPERHVILRHGSLGGAVNHRLFVDEVCLSDCDENDKFDGSPALHLVILVET